MPALNASSVPRATRARRDISRSSVGCSERDGSPYQSSSIQDRILQWQAQGRTALPPDALSMISVPRTDGERSAPTSRPHTPTDIVESPSKQSIRAARGRKSRRLVEAEQDEWIRRGRASTPRKRVVSDDHWRTSRTQSAGREGTPVSTVSQHEETSTRRRDEKAIAEAKMEREERRKRRVAARTNTSSRTKHDEASEADRTKPNVDIQSNVGLRNGYDSEREALSDASDNWGSLPDRDKDAILINSRYAATLGRPPESPLRSSLKTKSKMLNKTKAMLGLNETANTTPEFVTSIDAWLEEQPNTFSDGAAVKRSGKRQDQKHKSRQPRHREPSFEDNTEQKVQTLDDKRQRHLGEVVVESSYEPTNTSPTATPSSLRIKRTGAKSSRPRRHTLSQALYDDVQRRDVALRARETAAVAHQQDQTQVDAKSASRPVFTPPGRDALPLLLPPPTGNITTDGGNNGESVACSLKRQLTTHEDLISELSKPGRTRRSRRTQTRKIVKNSAEKDAVQTILSSLKEDNVRYTRELRTLVDGVIPVLLQCVLSKNDAMATAVLFTVATDLTDDQNVTKPIIDMGIALERLKSLHNRLSYDDMDRFMAWSQTAHRAYSDYLKAWRLGFQDVIVNLAPREDGEDSSDVMARDQHGDIVGADGEKVDVAYLLKRPLIRIRKMSKALNEIAELLKDNIVAQKISEDYVELTHQAKRKHQQEQGRLEDEAAAQVDVTRTRDLRTLGPLPGAVIEKGRRVRARDVFNLSLQHSSGQRVDCQVELILRDNTNDATGTGDVLICQIDESGKWLLFHPVALTSISARREESVCDMVVMIRGHAGLRSEWHELLALQSEEKGAVPDWLNMLGSNPLPPRLNLSEAVPEQKPSPLPLQEEQPQLLTSAALAQIASLEDVDVPLGEPSVLGARSGSSKQKTVADKPLPKLSLGGGLQQKTVPQRWLQQSLVPERKPLASPASPTKQHKAAALVTAASPVPSDSKTVDLRKYAPHPIKAVSELSRSTAATQQSSSMAGTSTLSDSATDLTSSSCFQSTSSATSAVTSPHGNVRAKRVSLVVPETKPADRGHHRRAVSLAVDQGNVTPDRSGDSPSRKSHSSTPLTESLREKWAAMSGWGRKNAAAAARVERQNMAMETSSEVSLDPPKPPEHKIRTSLPALNNPLLLTEPPQPPSRKDGPRWEERAHENVSIQLPDRTLVQRTQHTRSVSPPKVEYAASTATEEPDEYDDSDLSEDSISSSSDTSEDLGSELKDDLRSLPDMKRKRPTSRPPPVWRSAPSTTGTQTLAPSDSASQGPYRSVPSSSSYPQAAKDWCRALVCSWSDSGSWQPLRDDECAILVSPGLIEAFPIAQMNAQQDHGLAPLVAFELTPIVPLRKGTALDITIRSPPTANSSIKTTNNVMFRSRSLMDCEKLYHMINWARCNNPTWLELERARPKPQPAVSFAAHQPERPKSWFSFGGPQRRNSYRAGSMPPSIADSAATSGSVSNALSALKRLSRSSAFSINRSSVIRRPGRATNHSLFSADDTTASGSGNSTPAPPTQLGFAPGKDGPNVPKTSAEAVNGGGMVNNMRIKLFLRQGQDWKPLGVGRLSVLPAPVSNTPEASRPGSSNGIAPEVQGDTVGVRGQASMPGTPRREYRLPSSSHTPHRVHGNGREKRVLVTQKDRPDIVLLDEILGESCFEKVAERGIAVKVWTEDEMMRNQGGVLTGRGRLYMMQFGAQSEASWVFGLCGTYRYGVSNEN